jgi:hypothetical protein
MIPVELLKKIDTISALKVFTYLYEKSNSHGIIRVSLNNIVDDSSIARNSVKRGLQELLDAEILKQVANGKGNQPNTYRVPKVDTPKNDHTNENKKEINGWKKAVGTRKEEPTEPKVDHTNNESNIINNIIYKDFNEINFLNKDINSLSIPNDNLELNDEQLGKLARRVLVEWFLPLANFKKKQSPYFFPQQMKKIKDLLVEFRTEQVLASIEYWTKVNPPKDGMRSLVWLTYKRKKTSHMMIGLDYYKQQYINKQNEVDGDERKERVEEMKFRAVEIAKENVANKTKVDSMSDNDFLSDLLGGLGKIDKE